MGIASVTSISAVLMILGVVLILVLSINNAVVDTKLKFDEIEVFLEDDLPGSSLDRIEDSVRGYPEVLSMIFRPKEQALEIMKEEWGDEAYLLEGLETNPLPDSYIIKVNDIEYAENLVNNVKTLDGVEEVKYYKDVIDKLLIFAGYIQFGGIVIIEILVFISVFIISNTIKITVSSRRREINIMKYVGATNGYIRGPFIMEGIFLGVIGAGISIFIVHFGYRYFYQSMNEKLYDLFTFYLVDPNLIFVDLAIMFGTIGSGIGALGSMVSLKRFLNV